MNYIKYFILLSLLVEISACTSKTSKNNMGICNSLDVKVEEIIFPPSDVLQLKSYFLNSSFYLDTTNILVGYNYKVHALDCIDLNRKKISQIELLKDGPHAIMPLLGLYIQNMDSIWIYDESESVSLINKVGEIQKKIKLSDYLNDSEQIVINTNYAISSSHLYYDSKYKSLCFLVKDLSLSPASFKVKEISVLGDFKPKEYKLSPSVVELNIDNGYANLNQLNVNFAGRKIIYNYPIESHVYVMDMETGERKTINSDSNYTMNKAEKCLSAKDYSQWERHGVENPHFYDIMYIPKYKLYARLHLAERDFDTTKQLSYLIDDKDFYLTLLNENFEIVGESKLQNHRYCYFTGWCSMYDGLAIFVSNSLDSKNNSEDLIVDFICPLE